MSQNPRLTNNQTTIKTSLVKQKQTTYNNAPQGHFLASSQHFNPTSMTYANQTENYIYNDDNEIININDYNITRTKRNKLTTLTDGTYTKTTKINRYAELKDRCQVNVIVHLK
jgi:hypothetical protein